MPIETGSNNNDSEQAFSQETRDLANSDKTLDEIFQERAKETIDKAEIAESDDQAQVESLRKALADMYDKKDGKKADDFAESFVQSVELEKATTKESERSAEADNLSEYQKNSQQYAKKKAEIMNIEDNNVRNEEYQRLDAWWKKMEEIRKSELPENRAQAEYERKAKEANERHRKSQQGAFRKLINMFRELGGETPIEDEVVSSVGQEKGSSKGFYEALGLGKDATEEEIKQAYRNLAREHHPDRNIGDKKAEEKFKEVQEAYDVLGDKERRDRYDQLGG